MGERRERKKKNWFWRCKLIERKCGTEKREIIRVKLFIYLLYYLFYVFLYIYYIQWRVEAGREGNDGLLSERAVSTGKYIKALDVWITRSTSCWQLLQLLSLVGKWLVFSLRIFPQAKWWREIGHLQLINYYQQLDIFKCVPASMCPYSGLCKRWTQNWFLSKDFRAYLTGTDKTGWVFHWWWWELLVLPLSLSFIWIL